MNRSELIEALSRKTELSVTDVKQVLIALGQIVLDRTLASERVVLHGFGTFMRQVGSYRSPHTGEIMHNCARLRFKASAAVKGVFRASHLC